MKKLLPILLIAGCSQELVLKKNEETSKTLVCKMNNFKDFPREVSGVVSFELKNFVTIVLENKDKTEKVEMTFSKEKCNAK